MEDSEMSIQEVDQDTPQDLSDEVFIKQYRPRFTGTYSDVYIGTFRHMIVCDLSQMDRNDADHRVRWPSKFLNTLIVNQ